MTRFSGRKLLQQEILNRHVNEIRNLLHVLELRESFGPDDNRPLTDMYETTQAVVIEFDLPGVSLDAVSLTVAGATLTLEADKPRELHEGSFIRVERSHGHFSQTLQLPGNIDPARITAEYRMGVMRVICPKSGERLIPIQEL